MLKISEALLICLLLTSCVNYVGCAPVMTSGTQAIKNENVMNQIKPGVTDKNTVYQLLGAPISANNSPSGESWMYHYSEVNRKFVLIGWGGLFDSTLDSQSTMIQITFDDQNLVKSISGRPISGYGTSKTKYESKPLPREPVPVKEANSLENQDKNVPKPPQYHQQVTSKPEPPKQVSVIVHPSIQQKVQPLAKERQRKEQYEDAEERGLVEQGDGRMLLK